MKVIDIMQKVANGETPKFMIEDEKYFVDKMHWICEEDGERVDWLIDDEWLNKEVYLIEEDKKIEKIDMFDYFTGYDFDNTSIDLRKHLEINFQILNIKINEIIDYLEENK